VHDLPQLYTRPPLDAILSVLDLLRVLPSTFTIDKDFIQQSTRVDPEGVPRYLTSIISSSLAWLKDDDAREQVWNVASARLSERSGRNAAPSMTRSFRINDDLTVDLFEPSLTEDNLGLKTWTSSLLLAKRLPYLQKYVSTTCTRILELGAGTGLVGIAAACTWHIDVELTDLPEIVPNLQRNVDSNKHLAQSHSVHMTARALDWSDNNCLPDDESEKFVIILAADPIYSPDHSGMLVNTIQRWLANDDQACFILELPLRDAYIKEREDVKLRLKTIGMQLVDEGIETGFDDWQGRDGEPLEVECQWSVWRRIP
jgi:predicted nicotinamide N-methyase